MEHEIQSNSARRGAWRRRAVAGALGFVLAAVLTQGVVPAFAGSDFASPWSEEKYVRVRLINGGENPDGTWLVGVQIELKDGFYTYWRNPGDSGVPPQFTWNRSRNLANAVASWPAPNRLESEFGVSFGYRDKVVFPITIIPVADGPIQVKLDLNYAACSKICYLLDAKLDLTLPAVETSSSVFAPVLAGALSRVPIRQTATGTPRITTATPATSGDKIIMKVTTELAQAGDAATLFVEGPEQYYFRVPGKPATQNGTSATFDVAVEGASDIAEIKGAEMIATLVTPSGRVEHRWVVE